jgi:hypothetical protein
MTRAISRDSFDELKQYIGVHLQQGRVILDSDWNEGQDIMATLAARLGQDAFGDGVIRDGFEIRPVLPAAALDRDASALLDLGGIPALQIGPPQPLDALDSVTGWTLSGPGKLRVSRDRPYDGRPFLRLSDHTGQVRLTKSLPGVTDLSSIHFAFWRFRVNQGFPTGAPSPASFFIEDQNGVRNTWEIGGIAAANDGWGPGAAFPFDLHFHIDPTMSLNPAYKDSPYASPVISRRRPITHVSWTATGLPPGLSLSTITFDQLTYFTMVQGTPTTTGTFNVTITATSNGISTSRPFTLKVLSSPAYPPPIGTTAGMLDMSTTPIAGPVADLTKITKYGFDVFQAGSSMVWDFGALYLGNSGTVKARATNDFVISGPLRKRLVSYFQNFNFGFTQPFGGGDWFALENDLASKFPNTPRAYLGGIAATQVRDVLYSQQADPNDPPLAPPPPGAVRKDLVYLDAWIEPVTYIEDPELREVALGGPDTATRLRVRQRVRVAQGGGMPSGNGVGRGTLTTGGSYTDRANRLYLVEVDTAGDIGPLGNAGTATVRWSEDNGSTIQRVIEALPPGSTKVKVEDASAFLPGDLILIRKEFGYEEHQISSIQGNTITLQQATGAQLAQLPAAAGDASFTTFAVSDRPKIQRWNAFRVPIVADPNDSTLSASINLSHGVTLQFGGHAFRKGDFWTFRTRYLAGDDTSGISPTSRIETLDFALPSGVVHHYTPLALLIRDPDMLSPELVQIVRDQRKRGGSVIVHPPVDVPVGATTSNAGLVGLGLTSLASTFICIWSGTLRASNPFTMRLDVTFYNNDLRDPSTGNTFGVAATASTEFTNSVPGLDLAIENPWTSVTVIGGIVPPSNPQTVPFSRLGEVVAARGSFTIQSTVDSQPTIVGRLHIIELKPQLEGLADAISLYPGLSGSTVIFG